MAWRAAKSLTTLLNQVNAAYPKRNKAFDGIIGDAAHAAVASDHNPNAAGVVTALDLTNHPGYFDAHKLADTLITNRHPNLEYVISNGRIAGAWTNWEWQAYSGSNPHTKHIHVSVGDNKADGKATGNYDSTQPWVIKSNVSAPPSAGGSNVFQSDKEIVEAFAVAGRKPSASEIAAWRGGSKQRFMQLIKLETDGQRKQLADVKAALLNEQKKPPKEVVKIVEKIVDRPIEVIKEVKVGEEEAVRGFFGKLLDLVFKKG